MRKTLLLSVVASTMIMAGGDIAPVEPVVAAPAVASTWKFIADVKAIYQTTDLELYNGLTPSGLRTIVDNPAETGLFELGNQQAVGVSPYNAASAGGFSGRVGGEAQILSNARAGVQGQFFGSLGLAGDLFNDSMINAAYGTPGFDGNFDQRQSEAANLSQAWIEGTFGNTVAKIGRMELKTPMLSTEKWNLAYNTFEAVTLVNTDLPSTTLFGAFVTRHNGHGAAGGEGGNLLAGSPGRTVNMTDFTDLGNDGTLVLGATNKSIENTTLQAWYYKTEMDSSMKLRTDLPYSAGPTRATTLENVYWLQADTKVMDMFTLGGQFAGADGSGTWTNDSTIFAVKVGAAVAEGVNVYAAYSSADADGTYGFSDMSTGDKTNIYTGLGSIYYDGVLTAPGVDAFKIGGSAAVMGVNLAAAYINATDIDNATIDGLDFSAATKFGPVGVTAIYTTMLTNDQVEDIPFTVARPFYRGRTIDTLRLVASYNF